MDLLNRSNERLFPLVHSVPSTLQGFLGGQFGHELIQAVQLIRKLVDALNISLIVLHKVSET